jgi:hypothetical protein
MAGRLVARARRARRGIVIELSLGLGGLGELTMSLELVDGARVVAARVVDVAVVGPLRARRVAH